MLQIKGKNVLQWSDVLMQLQQMNLNELAKPAAVFNAEIGDFLAIESLTDDVAHLVQPAPKKQLFLVPTEDTIIE